MKELMYYIVSVTLLVESESGRIKKKKEVYLVSAVSVTDAEVKITKEFSDYSGDWSVHSVVASPIVKVVE